MNINLTIYDMENFLNKFTRFMTKDIYISNKMYKSFLKQYNYLYDLLNKEKFLYNENKKYKKVMNIITNKDKLLRLHNQKYLSSALKNNEMFFNNLNLDIRNKMIILTEEENTYIVESKNYDSLIVGKIKYLKEYKKYNNSNILILVDDNKKLTTITNTLKQDKLNISILNTNIYTTDKQLIDDNTRYNILINYIINKLFIDKEKFNKFYKTFSKYIYLNKDYKGYQTFKDYHSYMYKRKYQSSKLTLKGFNKKETNIRKNYLRTIKGEILKQIEEVDIANFLYLNSINYSYDNIKGLFKISLRNKNTIIKINSEDDIPNSKEDTIYLSKNKKILEVLAYELIKRSYPLELLDDNIVYEKLKDTNIGNYFSELCNKYLIPLIKHYEEKKTLDNINLDNAGKEVFLDLYKAYNDYLNDNNIVTKEYLLSNLTKEIEDNKYKYLFLVGDIKIDTNINKMTIIEDYPKIELINENIKLLYDYKKYLYENQLIPIPHTYISNEELTNLTNKFLKDNLTIINKNIEKDIKKIELHEYSDTNRLQVYTNISDICYNTLKTTKDSVIALSNLSDINILIGNNFSKLDNNTIIDLKNNKVKVEEILNLNKTYNTIVLPYLIKDTYHDDLILDNYLYNIKLMIYITLTKCKNKLILLCPTSKIKEFNKLLDLKQR